MNHLRKTIGVFKHQTSSSKKTAFGDRNATNREEQAENNKQEQ